MFKPPGNARLKHTGLFQAAAFGAALLLVTAGVSRAQTGDDRAIWVEDAVVAKGIENLKPLDPGTEFEPDVGKLYFFTRILSREFPLTVKHLWFQGDKFVMEINLPVKSGNWRTYSSKTIHPSSRGNWKVVATTEDGTVLETLTFTIH
ncbi:MAG TPA: DUF2914 domain-containing protein [Nitrospiria bacterium]